MPGLSRYDDWQLHCEGCPRLLRAPHINYPIMRRDNATCDSQAQVLAIGVVAHVRSGELFEYLRQ